MSEHGPDLDLALPAEDAVRLARLPALAALRRGRARVTAVELIWHDTPEGVLADAGVALCACRRGRERVWRLERLHADPIGVAPAVLGEGDTPDAAFAAVGRALPAPLLPVAACQGRLRSLPLGGEGEVATLEILEGQLRAVADEHPVCRVRIGGAPASAAALALMLAEKLPVAPASATLAGQALTMAGRSVPPPPLGAPELSAGQSVSVAFAHVLGHLTGVLLHFAPAAAAGETAEPVHQMRVALRRLRSAIALFKRATDCPSLQEAKAGLKALTRRLGPARDWDVFLAGTGAAVAAAFPEDKAVARLLASATRQRAESYAALRSFLHGPDFRTGMVRLVCLAADRPWERAEPAPDGATEEAAERQAAALAEPLAAFAARALDRRLTRLLKPGEDLAALPPEELHALRIEGKRLRYAAEFFAPLYSARQAKRFIRRVSALQDQLGAFNDGRQAAALLAALDGERSYAGGVVRGFVAAGRGDMRARVERAWRKFRRLEAFWA